MITEEKGGVQSLKKLDVLDDEEGTRYIIASVAYRHEKDEYDDFSEELHLTCLVVFKIESKD